MVISRATTFDTEHLETLKYETPFFVLSKDKMEANYKEFEDCFPDAIIYYAMKANSEPETLKLFADIGAGFEVASAYELEMLKKLKIAPDKIIYGTSIKPAAHIKTFFDYGVRTYACDSQPELEKIAALAPGSNVLIRINVNDAGSVFKFSEKFGTDKESAVVLLERAKELGLVPYGISFHVGSQASNKMAWANALVELGPALEHLEKLDITLEVIDFGGGFPCNTYASAKEDFSLEEIAQHTLKAYNELPYQPKIIMEPGRGLIANTAVIVASVIARIERKGNTWLFLDAGVYNGCFEAMAYQGSTRYRLTSMRPSYDAGEMLFEIAGPTGDSPDIITREALLPQDIQVGDKIIIHDVGAYSLVATCPFNGFPKPPVYYV